MNRLFVPEALYFFLISALFFVSCGTSKNAVLQSQYNEISSLQKENSALNQKVNALDERLKELQKENDELQTELARLQTESNKISVEASESESMNNLSDEALSSSSHPQRIRKFLEGGAGLPLDVSEQMISQIISTARSFIGTKYRNGGTSRNGVDCSGLLYASFQAAGVSNVPRTAENFARHGNLILAKKNLREGDLVFFTKTYNTPRTVTHAGLYLGNGKFIHSTNKRGVIISDIDDPYYWGDKYIFGTRLTR